MHLVVECILSMREALNSVLNTKKEKKCKKETTFLMQLQLPSYFSLIQSLCSTLRVCFYNSWLSYIVISYILVDKCCLVLFISISIKLYHILGSFLIIIFPPRQCLQCIQLMSIARVQMFALPCLYRATQILLFIPCLSLVHDYWYKRTCSSRPTKRIAGS